MSAQTSIFSLPTELLLHIFTPFSTHALLPLTAVSHRFHDVILRIIHHRLLVAASLEDHKLILECFHPASQFTEPYMECEYLGTDGLSNEQEGQGSLYSDVEKTGRLGKLSSLYCHFRPGKAEVDRRVRRRHPAGDVPNHPGTSTMFPGDTETSTHRHKGKLCMQTIRLDRDELFSQLCTKALLVRVGPRHGLFLSCVDVADGVLRVWRNWLSERAAPHSDVNSIVLDGHSTGMERDGREHMLWIDGRENVGLRLRVRENLVSDQPLIVHKDEDGPVSYSVEFEELLVRTTHLLLMLEQSLLQDDSEAGKAIVIGAFA